MLGSLSSGSSGPRPVISSRISETKSDSSCVLSASRSASTYCDTSCWTCRRISSSGSFSSAERLVSSISRRCRRTLASSSLSLSSGLAACGCKDGDCSGGISGSVVRPRRQAPDGAGSSTAGGSGAATRRAVKRPAIVHSYFRATHLRDSGGKLEFLHRRRGLSFRLRLIGRAVQHQLLELRGDLVTRLDLVERHAAIDRFAYQRVVVGDGSGERVAERLFEIVKAQTGREHALLEAVDDDLRMGSFAQPLLDRRNQFLGVTQSSAPWFR